MNECLLTEQFLVHNFCARNPVILVKYMCWALEIVETISKSINMNIEKVPISTSKEHLSEDLTLVISIFLDVLNSVLLDYPKQNTKK